LSDAKAITPFGGGGLSGIWTPDYGHSLMAANWSPTTHHGLTATLTDGLRYWEDYLVHEHVLDVDAGELTFTGRVEALPIAYERRYTFGDDSLSVALSLTVEEDVELADLVETIPIARGGWKERGARIVANDVNTGDVATDSFRIVDERGAGMQVDLDGERDLRLVPDGLQTSGWRQLQIGRVEIVLPANLQAGTTHNLAYTIRPLPTT